jgi:hypothetical protein
VKYQPYKGYHHKPWLSYGPPGYPRRVKTRHDWVWCKVPRRHEEPLQWWTHSHEAEACRRCNRMHCPICGCWQPWKKWDKNSDAANYQKRLVHRAFRRLARIAICRELAGDDGVSHAFYVSGEWLD